MFFSASGLYDFIFAESWALNALKCSRVVVLLWCCGTAVIQRALRGRTSLSFRELRKKLCMDSS